MHSNNGCLHCVLAKSSEFSSAIDIQQFLFSVINQGSGNGWP